MAEIKPMIAVPIGDPAGVGPEIVAKACALEKVNDAADVIVIGDRRVMENAIRIVGADLTINVVEKPADGDYRPGILNLIDLDNIDQSRFSYGVVQAMCGKAAFAYIKKSIELAMSGEADAVATTPINTEALHAAEVPFIGHTEIFGALTNTPDPLTMFETNGLLVFFLTRIVSISSMLGMLAMIPGSLLLGGFRKPVFYASLFAFVAVVWAHRTNIGRLLRGEEKKFTFKK